MTTNRITRAAGPLALLAALVVGACSNFDDRLLSVQTPDIIQTNVANSPGGAQSFYQAAVGDFYRFIGGDRGGSSPLGLALTGGLLGDEIFSARAGTEPTDDRSLNPNAFPLDTWTQVGNSQTRTIRAIQALIAYPPATGLSTQLAQLHVNLGYTYTIMAEDYCNGIPIWDGKDPNNPATITVLNVDLYNAAIAQYDSATTLIGTTSAAIRQEAIVGKARTLVDLAKAGSLSTGFAAAAAITGEVPTSFVYNTVFSTSTSGVVNGLYDWMSATKNFGASDKEGGNGLNYVSAGDARIKVDGTKIVRGQDGSNVPTFNLYTTTTAPIAISSGIEARLIEAESQLAAGNTAAWLASLNALRAAAQAYGSMTVAANALPPLTDPGTSDTRVNLMMRERAFWMYMSAHRLGDMRRLVRQYGRGTETVYPTGAYFKGGVYGTDAVLVPNQTETNNSNWKACTDKNP